MTVSSHATPLGARIALSLIVAVIVTWLVISWNDDRLQNKGIRSLGAIPTQPSAALGYLQDAKFLNVSREPEALSAAAWLVAGDRAKAVSLMKSVLEREPEYRTGWLLLANWLSVDDPAAAARAFDRAAQLDGAKEAPSK